MPLPLYQVDAFTDRPFAGNPAAVCVLAEPRPDEWMQSVAAEMNLAETAFLLPERDGFRLRWFTPTIEVDLCGHATLAAAHILWETARLPNHSAARFYTKSGLLTADRDAGGIVLDFPAEPAVNIEPPSALRAALGVELHSTGKNRMDYLVEVAGEAALRGLRPDFGVLSEVDCRGVIVTCRADDPRYDFLSRFFAPAVGINEDPVTGSAHCCLAPFWHARLGRTEMTGYQASARGGVVGVRIAGDRVKLFGLAVTVLRGELCD